VPNHTPTFFRVVLKLSAHTSMPTFFCVVPKFSACNSTPTFFRAVPKFSVHTSTPIFFPTVSKFTYHKLFTMHHAFLVRPHAHIHVYAHQFLVNSAAEIEAFA
jgi:hypothetical protein